METETKSRASLRIAFETAFVALTLGGLFWFESVRFEFDLDKWDRTKEARAMGNWEGERVTLDEAARIITSCITGSNTQKFCDLLKRKPYGMVMAAAAGMYLHHQQKQVGRDEDNQTQWQAFEITAQTMALSAAAVSMTCYGRDQKTTDDLWRNLGERGPGQIICPPPHTTNEAMIKRAIIMAIWDAQRRVHPRLPTLNR